MELDYESDKRIRALRAAQDREQSSSVRGVDSLGSTQDFHTRSLREKEKALSAADGRRH